MSDLLKKFYYNMPFGSQVFIVIKKFFRWIKYAFIPTEYRLKKRFYEKLGYELNLNNPSTLNEKVNWLKIHARAPIYTQCADKYRVRAYVKERLGEEFLIPLVLATKNVKDISESLNLAYPVILKANHNSTGGIILKDVQNVDWEYVRRRLRSNLAHNHYYPSREWQYKNIEPMVVVEKLLMEKDGRLPDDYKFHCMNGKVTFLQIDKDRQGNHTTVFYTPEWERLDFKLSFAKGKSLEKPKDLDYMISLAETLSVEFDYARIDFYNIDGKVYFGEITFHPGSGYSRFPRKVDQYFGDLLTLSSHKR